MELGVLLYLQYLSYDNKRYWGKIKRDSDFDSKPLFYLSLVVYPLEL